MVAASPHHYRRLVDAAWSGLSASGHRGDTILIGETAPRGGKKPSQLGNAMPPAEFVRELYCLRRNFRPYRGRAARIAELPGHRRGAPSLPLEPSRPVQRRWIWAAPLQPGSPGAGGCRRGATRFATTCRSRTFAT